MIFFGDYLNYFYFEIHEEPDKMIPQLLGLLTKIIPTGISQKPGILTRLAGKLRRNS